MDTKKKNKLKIDDLEKVSGGEDYCGYGPYIPEGAEKWCSNCVWYCHIYDCWQDEGDQCDFVDKNNSICQSCQYSHINN